MLQTILKIWIKNKLLLTMWLLLTSLCILILSLAPENPLLSLVSVLTKEQTEKIILVLLLVLIGLLVSLIITYLKNKNRINLQEFTLIDPPGYYTHPKYSYPICQNCLIKTDLISPVSQIDENTWFCNICEKHFPGGKGEVFTIPD